MNRVEHSRTPKRPKAFEFADRAVEAGTRRQIDLPVARLAAGSWTHMPIVVIHGKRPGPTVWLSGALHGDELNGVEIVRQLIKRIDPQDVSGTLLAVPIVNVFGVGIGSRYLPDRRDLNRSFPGSRRGSLASRIARLFYDQVASRCTLGIDFHTGSNGRSNLPQLRCDLDDEETRRLAFAFHPPLVMHATLRDGSLRAAARDAGIPVLLYEGGEAHRFDDRAIETGINGARRVLRAVGVLHGAWKAPKRPLLVSRSSRWMRAQRTGFAHVDVDLGESVAAGQTLATIADSTASTEVSVRSTAGGRVIGILRNAHVYRGDALVHVAEIDA